MKKYKCGNCGYVYDPEEGDELNGVEQGTDFRGILEGWVCPVCFSAKEEFREIDDE